MPSTSRDQRNPHGFVQVGDDDEPDNQPSDGNEEDRIVCGPRPKVASNIILQPDGKNYIGWKTVLPTVLDGEPRHGLLPRENSTLNNNSLGEDFIVDTGTTMASSLKWMTEYQPFDLSREVKLGGARALSARGSGTAKLVVNSNGKESTMLLKYTLFVPNLRRNLESVSKITEDGFTVNVSTDNITLVKGSETVIAERRHGPYVSMQRNQQRVIQQE